MKVKTRLAVKYFDGIPYRYRPDTTDEKVAKEVIEKRCYRRASIGFDVESGERWLDLGANVGAFAVYCKTRGATAECYEPEPGCFAILERNAAGFSCRRAAVTHLRDETVSLRTSTIEGNHYRGTVIGAAGRSSSEPLEVLNVYAGDLWLYDGVKMDIEGAEFGIIDNELVPECRKLCLEYHTSRDDSMENLARRVALLRKRFSMVNYVPELDKMMVAGGYRKSFHDRVIYCIK